jgi:hypothetical protein
MKKRILFFISLCAGQALLQANGLNPSMAEIDCLYDVQSRSVCPENLTGEKGRAGMATNGTGQAAARDLGQGWKISPSINIEGKTTFTLADITGPGSIRSIWMTPTGNWRWLVLRFYWDDETEPSVEVPVADFFASGWARWDRCPLISSAPVCVNPRCGFNCYWPMPFRKKCRITMENLADEKMTLYYQINYVLGDVPTNAAYFHAQFRRQNPLRDKGIYTILDGVEGSGQYVGTYLAYGPHRTGWWGEGEVKFFIDGDDQFPTICGTGTEDYFGGAWGFGANYSAPFLGYTDITNLTQPNRPMGRHGNRHGMYRFHILDPIRFQKNLCVTMQAIGWRSEGRYLPLQDDIASVAFWYQAEPHVPFPTLQDRDCLEVI